MLRSKSDLPEVIKYRELIHKIGVTGGSVGTSHYASRSGSDVLARRCGNCGDIQAIQHQPNTPGKYLPSTVRRSGTDLSITDRFGQPVKPKEWFLVPLHVIDAAVEKIRDGSITEYIYDPLTASLTQAGKRKSS